jgi:hypothetical protein
MAKHLKEPLPTALGAIATAMMSGAPHGTFGKGGGSYNWREIVQAQRELALAFLRQAVEARTDGVRTIRTAHSRLLPFPAATPIFLLVVCLRGRSEDGIRVLEDGDVLFFITAPDALAEGMVLRRLN